MLSSNGELFVKEPIPATGEYEIRVRVFGQQVGPDPVRMAIRVDGTNARLFEVKAIKETPEVNQISVPLRAGDHRISVAFLNEFANKSNPQKTVVRKLTVESLSIDGPKNAEKLPPPPAGEVQ